MQVPGAEEMLGRVFDGSVTRSMTPEPLAEDGADINGQPGNPTARPIPPETSRTGISAIDV